MAVNSFALAGLKSCLAHRKIFEKVAEQRYGKTAFARCHFIEIDPNAWLCKKVVCPQGFCVENKKARIVDAMRAWNRVALNCIGAFRAGGALARPAHYRCDSGRSQVAIAPMALRAAVECC
jgi:hypothetical protein